MLRWAKRIPSSISMLTKVEDNDWTYIQGDDSGKDFNVGVGEIINGK